MNVQITTETPPNAFQSRLPVGLALLCFAVLGASYIVNAMDRQVFAMVLPFVMKEYGFNLRTGGLLVSIFTLGIGLAGIPAAYLLERLSRKSVMMIAIAVYSVFTILTAQAAGLADMFLYRTATGFGEGMQVAVLYTAVGAYFPKYRALVFASLSAMFGIGNSISPLIARHLLETGHWRVPLIIFGSLGFVFVVLMTFVSRDFFEHQEIRGEAETEADIPFDGVWSRDLVLAVIAAVTSHRFPRVGRRRIGAGGHRPGPRSSGPAFHEQSAAPGTSNVRSTWHFSRKRGMVGRNASEPLRRYNRRVACGHTHRSH